LPIGNLASDVPNSPSIAASKVEEEDMDELKELVTQQAKMLETLGRGVELLLSDRQAAIDAETAKTQAAALEQTIESRVAAMLANQLNPTGQPQRLTTPVLASVESVPDAALKVAQLEGSLQALSQLGRGDAEARQKMLKLRDELIAAKRSLTTV
jgi:septation ring formation regulator EzrA